MVPLLKDRTGKLQVTSSAAPSSGAAVIGTYLDPFVSLIRHQCEGNSWIIFEPNSLHVRAVKAIPVHIEITTSYLGPCEVSQELRHNRVLEDFKINCQCPPCSTLTTTKQPEGSLKARLQKFDFEMLEMSADVNSNQIRALIDEMKTAGFGYETVPMHILDSQAEEALVGRCRMVEGLQLVLLRYFVIQPVQVPRMFPASRLSTLAFLVAMLEIGLFADDLMTRAFLMLLELVREVRGSVLVHLKFKLLGDTVGAYGEDSMSGKIEKTLFEESRSKLRLVDGEYSGCSGEYVPLIKSKEENNKYVEAMKKLLGWAGVGGFEEKEFFFDDRDGQINR